MMNKVIYKNLMYIVVILGLVLISCDKEDVALDLNEIESVIVEDISTDISQS